LSQYWFQITLEYIQYIQYIQYTQHTNSATIIK
jgi:hypothetical protein